MAFIPIRRLVGGAGEPLSDQHGAKGLGAAWRSAPSSMICVLGLVYVPGSGRRRSGKPSVDQHPRARKGLSARPSEIAKWGISLRAWYCACGADGG